jgi:hypothetical protein
MALPCSSLNAAASDNFVCHIINKTNLGHEAAVVDTRAGSLLLLCGVQKGMG